MYVCGPTVYHFAHIGNMRAYVTWDILRRVLERNQFKVSHVMNITDVGHLQADADDTEDKMEKAAKEEHKTPQQIARFYTDAFMADMHALNNKDPTTICKATGHIEEMIKLIQKLEKNGYTYITENGVYFHVQKFAKYGKFSQMSIDQLKGARDDVVRDPEKKHPADFRLWQLNQPHHVQQWDSPWGKGYPGWHIECSAMSMKYLGNTFDIHTGGIDHIFPHHQNEIAQSEGATGKTYADYWLHNAFMLVNGNKMSKSLRNIYTITDLKKKGFDPLSYRYLLLTTHYRSEINFTWESIEVAQKTRKNWNAFIKRLQKYTGKTPNPGIKELILDAEEKVNAQFNDDLNTSLALATLSDFSRKINEWLGNETMSKADARKVLAFIEDINNVLGVFDFDQDDGVVPAHVIKFAKDREAARKAKDWKKSDELRDQIAMEGFAITDTKNGFELNRL